MTNATSDRTIDVRAITPQERHSLIFSTFHGLTDGQTMELVNDHNPEPLHMQFMVKLPGKFDWQVLEQGPAIWRIAITRVNSGHGSGRCCGSCGGA